MSLDSILYKNVTVSDLIIAAGILVVCVLLSKFFSVYLRRFYHKQISRDTREITIKLVYYFSTALGFIAILPILGFNPSSLLVTGGIIGIALGFASQNIISNLIAGIFLMIERPIKIGNMVNIDGTEGVEGFVEDIRILSTTIRTYQGHYVRIPNRKVFTSNITNFVANTVRRFEYDIGIKYTEDIENVKRMIKRAITNHPFALKRPNPGVFVNSLSENSIILKVRVWAPASEWYEVKTELLQKIWRALQQEGIEIPLTQRVLWFANSTPKEEIEMIQ